MAAIDDRLFCFSMLCEQVQADPSLGTKRDMLRTFVSRYTGDLGLLFKLLLPKYNGRLYHLQDKQLLKLLSAALGQPEAVLRQHLNGSGCIATTAAHYFKPRAQCVLDAQGFCNLRLPDLDQYLDRLSSVTTEFAQGQELTAFLSVACKNALFLYLRQVKQDLRLGAGIRIVLEGLHPSANNIFKRCANIQEVVRRVQAGDTADDGDDGYGSGASQGKGGGVKKGHVEAKITLFMPLAPMLAAPSNGVDHVLQKCPNGAFSETKYDGERIQIHKNGASFKFFARSLKPMKEDKFEGLEKYLIEAVQAQSCILDGEILLVDVATSQPLPFGTLGKHKKTQFSTACTCIFLFDILYKDGQTLLDMPMDQRREQLKASVCFIQNRVMLSEMRLVTGTPDQRRAIMQRHLQYAVAEGLEGLVVKDTKSVYEPGSRHWIKLKKDYLQGMADSADLVVIGAWYGSGNKGGILSTFLMGARDTTMPNGAAKSYKTVIKVGNGHDDATLATINQFLMSQHKTQPGGPNVAPPHWLDINNAHLPDVYISPVPAIVWEISAAEFTATKSHTAGFSMRFPRITRIRDDKDANTATSLQELIALVQASSAKGNKLGALGAHQQLHGDDADEDTNDPVEPGVMMRTSSRYGPDTAVVQGQHFGRMGTTVLEQLRVRADGGTNAATRTATAPAYVQPPLPVAPANQPGGGGGAGALKPLERTASVVDTSPIPFWVFSAKGFKGSAPPPLPQDGDQPDAPSTGSIEYVSGDATQLRPISAHPHQHALLIHCCAVGMAWSSRGAMGAIARTLGDEPQTAYDIYAASTEARLGDVILCEVSNRRNKGRVFVATLLVLRPPAQGAPPAADQDALENALLAHVLPFAKAHQCAVHIPKADRSSGVQWAPIDKVLRYTYSRQHGLRVVVYQRGDAAPPASAVDGQSPPSIDRTASLRAHVSDAGMGAAPLNREHTAAAAPPARQRTADLALAGTTVVVYPSEGPAASQVVARLTGLGAAIATDARAATHVVVTGALDDSSLGGLLHVLCAARGAAVVRASWVMASEAQGAAAPTEAHAWTPPSSSPSSPPAPIRRSPSATGPLGGAFVVLAGFSADALQVATAQVQDMGGVVQSEWRVSDCSRTLVPMRMARTGEVVSVPLGRSTHMVVHAQRRDLPGRMSSFNGISRRHVPDTPPGAHASPAVALVHTPAVKQAVDRVLGLGGLVVVGEWLAEAARLYPLGDPPPAVTAYLVDDCALLSDEHAGRASAPTTPLCGTKRPRSPSPVRSPHSTIPAARSLRAGSTAALIPFLRPASKLVFSVHGYGAAPSADLADALRSLQILEPGRSFAFDSNLSLFAAATSLGEQRILVCETLTATSMPLLRAVAAATGEAYHRSTVVTAEWPAACLAAGTLIPVEPFLYRPPCVFSLALATPLHSAPQTPHRAPPVSLVPPPPASDSETDTDISYATLQRSRDGSVTESEGRDPQGR